MKLKRSELFEVIRNSVISVLEEGGYVGKFNRFGGQNQSKNQVRSGNLQISYGKAEVARSKKTGLDKEYIAIYLGHIWKDGGQRLADAIQSAIPKQILYATVDNTSKERVVLKVNIDLKHEIPNYIAKIGEAIRQLNDYSEYSIDNFCSRLYDVIDNVVTQEDSKNAERITISNWKEMLERLTDPSVRQRLLNYQMSNQYAKSYGNVLSPNNKQDILDQFPNASFVVEASTWRNKFNRQVMPNAQRIIVTKPYGVTNHNLDLDAAAQRCGFDSYKDAKEKTKNATQVLNRIKIEASKGKNTLYKKVIMYDVSQTIPPPNPKDDVWTNEIGLSNNIMGVLNQNAQNFDDKEASGSVKKQLELNRKEVDKAQLARWKNRRLALAKLCEKYKIDVRDLYNEGDSEFIAKATFRYAQKVIPSAYGVILTTDIKRIALMCAVAVCISSDCDIPKSISSIYYSQTKLTEDDAIIAYRIMRDVIPKMNRLMDVDIKPIGN